MYLFLGSGYELLKNISIRISTFSSNMGDVLDFSKLINDSRTRPVFKSLFNFFRFIYNFERAMETQISVYDLATRQESHTTDKSDQYNPDFMVTG
jgi:hypothetical protein